MYVEDTPCESEPEYWEEEEVSAFGGGEPGGDKVDKSTLEWTLEWFDIGMVTGMIVAGLLLLILICVLVAEGLGASSASSGATKEDLDIVGVGSLSY